MRSHGGTNGFGGNTTDTATIESDAAYEQSVHDFSLSFNKSQTTISGLTATNTQVDTFIIVIMECGLFNTSYEKWHVRPDKNKT